MLALPLSRTPIPERGAGWEQRGFTHASFHPAKAPSAPGPGHHAWRISQSPTLAGCRRGRPSSTPKPERGCRHQRQRWSGRRGGGGPHLLQGGEGAPVTALGGQSIRWCLCPPCSPAHAPPAEMRFPPAHFKGGMTSFWAISPPCRLGSLWGFGIRTVPIPPGASASPVRPWVMAYIYHGDQNPGPSLRSSHSWETELARCQSRKSKVTTLSELLSEKHWWHDST